MTILAMVNADKEGQIESKMMKARQLEEIREARKAETERRQEERKKRLDETKEGIRKKRKRPSGEGKDNTKDEALAGTSFGPRDMGAAMKAVQALRYSIAPVVRKTIDGIVLNSGRNIFPSVLCMIARDCL